MSDLTPANYLTSQLLQAGIEVRQLDERAFPGERWLIAYLGASDVPVAQLMAGDIERHFNTSKTIEGPAIVVVFRAFEEPDMPSVSPSRGKLSSAPMDQLIQLLEARSRTSDALPSLKYMEDPRASLSAVGATRHHLIYGRRGVGKTALLLEAKRRAENSGHTTAWINAQVLRNLDAHQAFVFLAESILTTLSKRGGTSTAEAFRNLQRLAGEFSDLGASGASAPELSRLLPSLNAALKAVLTSGIARLYVFIDDFYLLPTEVQPAFLDYLAGALRDCDGWIKIASIERLTRPYEPSSRLGLEVPHDASTLDIDVTLEDPAAAQAFLESVLINYTATVGIGSNATIAKPETWGRLVFASGGVPRDYLNLFASSIVVARQARQLASSVGREDVAVAAGRAAKTKKRDLELDVSSANTGRLLYALSTLTSTVKSAGYAYFRVDSSLKNEDGFEMLSLLVDLRFVHLVQANLSDQHRSGVRYEAYVLDLSEVADVRLKRGLRLLDIEHGNWTHRLPGKARTKESLNATQLRDILRLSPLVDVRELVQGG